MGNSTAIDTAAVTRVNEFLDEAISGPDKGGVAGDVHIGGVTIEAVASRGWGVEFSRHLPSGATARERLTGDDLTIVAASTAIGKLLNAA